MMSVVISALIGALTIQGRAKEAGDAKLRLAQEEVERLAKLAERERIARDMHDLLGHTLSVVVLKSELAQKLMSRDPAKAMQEMAEVERISRQGLAEVREAITGYRSSGLAAEIEHVRETLTAAGIDTTIEARRCRSRRPRKPRCRWRFARRRPTSSATPPRRSATSGSTRRTGRR